MLQFHRVGIEDRDRLLPMLTEKDRGCEYTFSNIYLYRDIYDASVAYREDAAVVSFGHTGSYLMPVGCCDLEEIVSELPAREDGTYSFVCITEEDTNRLRDAFPGRIVSVTAQDDSEYVYSAEDLAELKGKKYHAKRNFCSRFERLNPGYEFETITEDNIAEVSAMNEEWYSVRRDSGLDLSADYACSSGALREFRELGLIGALISVSGKVVAWCCGEMISEGVFCTHVEKAFGDMEGDYAVINRDFARMLRDRFELINREDDAGDEGLMRAKLSYHPVYTLKKNTVVISS